MIRQLGCPTFFLTLSDVENKWTELLKILKQILDYVKLSIEEILEFKWSERAYLIRRDPVTCARYFDHRSKVLFKVLRSEVNPLRKLTDYYLRIEFQQRVTTCAFITLGTRYAQIWSQSLTRSDKIY